MPDLLALVLQQSINGVYLGCLYVMVALGLTLIYGVLNQINFAHADFVTAGAFTAFFAATRLATKLLGLPATCSPSCSRSARGRCSACSSTRRCSRRCASAATSCARSSRRSGSRCS